MLRMQGRRDPHAAAHPLQSVALFARRCGVFLGAARVPPGLLHLRRQAVALVAQLAQLLLRGPGLARKQCQAGLRNRHALACLLNLGSKTLYRSGAQGWIKGMPVASGFTCA